MPEPKLDFKKILPVFVIILVDLLGLTIIIPLMPLYATSFGASAFTIGALGAAYPIMQFIGAPILGGLSDRYGRRRVLLVSQVGTFVGFLILGVADTLWLLFLARVIDGISGANFSTAQAAISDSTTEKTRTQGLGLVGAAFGIGFTIGPAIAFVALVASDDNYHVPAFVAALFSLISILLTFFWFEETLPESQRGMGKSHTGGRHHLPIRQMWAALQRPQIGILLALIFAQQIAFGGFEQLLSLFTLSRLGLNASGNAIIFVFVGVLVVMVQGYFIGKWSRRYGDYKLVYLGLTALAAGLILTALTPEVPVNWYSRSALEEELEGERELPGENPSTEGIAIPLPNEEDRGWLGLLWILVAMIPVSVGGSVLQPSINSLITQKVSASEVGGLLGISASFLSAANALAPLIGGAIFDAVGSTAPFLAGGLMLLVLFGVALRTVKPPALTSVPAATADSAAR